MYTVGLNWSDWTTLIRGTSAQAYRRDHVKIIYCKQVATIKLCICGSSGVFIVKDFVLALISLITIFVIGSDAMVVLAVAMIHSQ